MNKLIEKKSSLIEIKKEASLEVHALTNRIKEIEFNGKGEMKMRREIKHKGIDVSRWQGLIVWEHVAESGQVDFAMLRIGGCEDEFYKDTEFEYNYAESKKAGIDVGAYYMLPRVLNGKVELICNHILQLLGAKQFEFPIALDVELQKPEDAAITTESVKQIGKFLETHGYYVVIYSSSNLGFKQLLYTEQLDEFDKWVAQWHRNSPTYPEKYGLWQRSNKGVIPGIIGDVDIDAAYYDYPAIIKHAGLNGFTANDKIFPHCNKNCNGCTHNCPCKGIRPENTRYDKL